MKKRKLPKKFIKKKLEKYFIKNKLRKFFIRKKFEKCSLLHFIFTSIKNNKKLQIHLIKNVVLSSIITAFVLYLIKNNNIELSNLLSINYLVSITLCSFVNTFIYFQIKEYDELSDMKWWLATSSIYLILCLILWIISVFMVGLFNIKSFSITLYIPSAMVIVSDNIALIYFIIKAFFTKEEDLEVDNNENYHIT